LKSKEIYPSFIVCITNRIPSLLSLSTYIWIVGKGPYSPLGINMYFIFSFLRCGIKTIINLQRPGEHASCGNPLEQESGFTYLPEAFMEAGSMCTPAAGPHSLFISAPDIFT